MKTQTLFSNVALKFQYYVKPTTVLMFFSLKNKNVLGEISPWCCVPLLEWSTNNNENVNDNLHGILCVCPCVCFGWLKSMWPKKAHMILKGRWGDVSNSCWPYGCSLGSSESWWTMNPLAPNIRKFVQHDRPFTQAKIHFPDLRRAQTQYNRDLLWKYPLLGYKYTS